MNPLIMLQSIINVLILTGKKSLWEAQGLNSFLHSSLFSCKGKVIGRTLYVNEWFVDVLHSFSWNRNMFLVQDNGKALKENNAEVATLATEKEWL
jgi:hypothetical protein